MSQSLKREAASLAIVTYMFIRIAAFRSQSLKREAASLAIVLAILCALLLGCLNPSSGKRPL